MQAGIFSYALLGALATALVVAAVTDIKRREIDNWLNLAIALAAPLYWIASGMSLLAVGFQIGLAVVTFIFACALFAFRQMGGGDVKLLTALSLWFVPESFLPLVMMMALIGGGASIGMALFNMKRVPGETARDAVAALMAVLFVYGCGALVWSMMTHRPAISPALIGVLSSLIPNIWIGLVAILVVTFIFTLGLVHIVKRQKSRLPVPYGVAISAAGLWVLANNMFLAGSIAKQFG